MFEPVVASQLCENFDKLSKEEKAKAKNRACFIRVSPVPCSQGFPLLIGSGGKSEKPWEQGTKGVHFPYQPSRFQVAFLEYIGGRWS